MFKLTAIVSLMLVGSTLRAARLHCDSCGSECAPACGTRHFRTCCFNYLRKKRGQDALNLSSQNLRDMQTEGAKAMSPFFPVEDSSELRKHYPYDNTLENRLQLVYDV